VATVFAVDDGLVTHVGVIAGRGTVSIRHVSGIRSTYEPIDATVRVGESVTRGQALGLMASALSHCPSGCLHLGAKRGDTYLDPLLLLTVPRIVLMTPVPD
jgi:murein DD-endopeptidase MepM/ murein hydrolase activator NlpD